MIPQIAMDALPPTGTIDELTGPEVIESLRRRIDAVDDAIAELVVARACLSAEVQAARVSAGGPRVVLSRERAIHQRYQDALGSAGRVVAEAILQACRGTIVPPSQADRPASS